MGVGRFLNMCKNIFSTQPPSIADKMFASHFVLGFHSADLQIHFYKCFAACGGQKGKRADLCPTCGMSNI